MTRRGQFSFESILILAFIILLSTTVLAVYKFHQSRINGKQNPEDIVVVYSSLLDQLRADALFANKLEINTNQIKLFENEKLLASYRFENKTLMRTDSKQQEQILLRKIENGGFHQPEKLDNLFSVWILPENKMDIPFITSFAIRGENAQ